MDSCQTFRKKFYVFISPYPSNRIFYVLSISMKRNSGKCVPKVQQNASFSSKFRKKFCNNRLLQQILIISINVYDYTFDCTYTNIFKTELVVLDFNQVVVFRFAHLLFQCLRDNLICLLERQLEINMTTKCTAIVSSKRLKL